MAATYHAFGLVIRSAIALPALPPAESGDTDVLIELGAVEPPTDGRIAVDGATAVLAIPEVGRFRIEGGRRILVDADPGAAARNVQLFLLGSVMGVLLHQRGVLPLHANAIAHAGRAVAIAGASGSGKSTLAAWFLDRGRDVLADDVCALTFDPGGRAWAHPGVPRLRLWRDALAASGRDPLRHQRAFDNRDKVDGPAPPAARTELPLRAIYLLGSAPAPRFRLLRGATAVAALAGNTYRGAYVDLAAGGERHWRQCVTLASQVPVFAFDRPWDARLLETGAAMLDAHAFGKREEAA